jgi:hypothetical protein
MIKKGKISFENFMILKLIFFKDKINSIENIIT